MPSKNQYQQPQQHQRQKSQHQQLEVLEQQQQQQEAQFHLWNFINDSLRSILSPAPQTQHIAYRWDDSDGENQTNSILADTNNSSTNNYTTNSSSSYPLTIDDDIVDGADIMPFPSPSAFTTRSSSLLAQGTMESMQKHLNHPSDSHAALLPTALPLAPNHNPSAKFSSPPSNSQSLSTMKNSIDSINKAATPKLRILILMSDTGGGHRASAQALESAFHSLYPGHISIKIVDFWVEIAGWPFASFPAQYAFAAKHPPLWQLAYWYAKFPPTRATLEFSFNLFSHERVKSAFEGFAPDLIISVHPMIQELSLRVLRRIRKETRRPTPPYLTVVTDYGGAHPMWFNPATNMCYVPSQPVWDVAVQEGLEEQKLKMFGLPIRSNFWELADPQVLKSNLGLKLDTPTILLVGGGDGVGSLGKIAENVAARIAQDWGSTGAQMVVICGKNEKLKNQLSKVKWQIPVIVHGFVRNMHEWMIASDCIITKAGPGTIAEALICGLPIILSGFLPGQEEGNVKYVVENNVGYYTPDPVEMARVASTWLGDKKLLKDMRERAKQFGRPNASKEIASSIFEVYQEETEKMMIAYRRRVSSRFFTTIPKYGLLVDRLGFLFQTLKFF